MERYRKIQRGVIRRFRQDKFIVSDALTFEDPSGGYVIARGQIQCLGALNIDVIEKLRIVSRSRGSIRVAREGYKFNVSVSGRGNRFRHDSGHPAHNHRPHEHRFDSSGRQTSRLDVDAGDELPTLRAVIEETREFYWSPEFALESSQSSEDAA